MCARKANLKYGVVLILLMAVSFGVKSAPSTQAIFEMKLRCSEMAKEQPDAIKVCYSPSRNTCLARIVRYPGDGIHDTEYAVVDLLAGKTLAGYCWWTNRQPNLNHCLLFEPDEAKASAWVRQQQTEMDALMTGCAE